jgi:arylsulfatase A-like enzyme
MSGTNHKPVVSRRDFLKLSLALGLLGLSDNTPLQVLSRLSGAPDRNILIIVFDTLSGAHLPFYRYPRQTAPNLARLAQHANVYHNHHSTGNFTTPGTASIFTGVHPWTHRALHLHGPMLENFAKRTIFHQAAPGTHRVSYSHNLLVTSLLFQARSDLEKLLFARTLAQADLQYSDLLFSNDYNASIWSEAVILRDLGHHPSSLFLSQIFRLLRGWNGMRFKEQFAQEFPGGIPVNNDLYFTLEKGIDWCIDNIHKWPQPFMGYIHFMPPHYPYLPRQDFMNQFADNYRPIDKPRHRFSEQGNTKRFLLEKRQAYDEYLAYADSEFGRLYDFLSQKGFLENTYLIVTSDHGEMFERGIWGHSTRVMYEPLLHVPLLVSQPGQRNRQDFHSLTSSIDLLPTLMQATGQPIPSWSEGKVLPGFPGFDEQSERRMYAMELKENAQYSPLSTGTFVLFQGPYKYTYYQGYQERMEGRDELYNLENDPEELDNRVQAQSTLAAELKAELVEKLAEINAGFDPRQNI